MCRLNVAQAAMSKLAYLLQGLGRPRIAVVGDPMLDCYTWCDVDRVSPEAPVLVLRVDHREWRLGGAASVAGLLRGLEAETSLSGVVGDDSAGHIMLKLVAESGIDHGGLLVDPNRVTTTKERLMGRTASRTGSGGQQIVRVDQEQRSPVSREIERQLTESISSGLDGCAALLISDYNKGVCTPGLLATLIEAANARRIPVIVDPARITDYSRYQNATLLVPNRSEAEAVTGLTIDGPESAQAAAAKLCRDCSARAVIVKLDSEGMVLYEAGGRCRHFATRAREVYDVTGAGDMVLAVVGLCLADGVPWADAVELANLAAGLQVERLGVQAITRDELARALPPSQRAGQERPRCQPIDLNGANDGQSVNETSDGGEHRDAFTDPGATAPDSPRTVLSLRDPVPKSEFPSPKTASQQATLAQIGSLADAYHAQGKRITFTNGCFDLLHVGHVTCLQEAARLGDVLIVAVNSDASVRRLKGPNRPVIDEQSRAALLAALECVDHVIIFDDATPHELLHAIRPHVLAKGGTYSPDQVVGREVVESYGGKVCVLGEFAAISTTRILASVQDMVQFHSERSRCLH